MDKLAVTKPEENRIQKVATNQLNQFRNCKTIWEYVLTVRFEKFLSIMYSLNSSIRLFAKSNY